MSIILKKCQCHWTPTFDSPFLLPTTTHPREINLLHSAFWGKSKGGRQNTEVRSQKSEVRRVRAKKRQKSGEIQKQNSEVRIQKVGGERQGLGIGG